MELHEAAGRASQLAEDLSDMTDAQNGPDTSPEAHTRAAAAHRLAERLWTEVMAYEPNPEERKAMHTEIAMHHNEAEYHDRIAYARGWHRIIPTSTPGS